MFPYDEFLKLCNNASTFELYKLSHIITRELTNPTRISEIKRALTIGYEVSFFNKNSNTLEKGRVISLKQKYAEILTDKYVAQAPYYIINIDNIEDTTASEKLDRHSISVEQEVGFKDKAGNLVYAKVIRLNDKTVTLEDTIGRKWRVGYSFLFKVLPSETVDRKSLMENNIDG